MFRRIKKNVRQMRASRSASQESSESNESSTGRGRRRTSSQSDDNEMTDYLFKVEELAAFDACVETSDALAASSPYTTSSAKYDKETGLTDCSVLVSPDGNLLLLPNEPDSSSSKENSSHERTNGEKDFENKETTSPPDPPATVVTNQQLDDLGGDFESAVFMGNDLRTGGDKAINGFSAMGWAPSAASLAIRQSEDSVRNMASFVEDIMLIRKEGAARASQACDKLRTTSFADERENETPPTSEKRKFFRKRSSAEKEKDDPPSASESSDMLLVDGDAPVSLNGNSSDNDSSNNGTSTPSGVNRVGPLQFPGGTIQEAKQALEQYHSLMSENDANRWRMASMSNFNSGESLSKRNISVGVLPALRHAADQTADRSYKRERALREMQRRADAIDAKLAQCKEESKRRWEAVHDAEERVTRIVEERMLERSRQREKLRMEQLRETYAEEEDNPQLGATPNEIWDLVSAVAESMEGGSFEPTGLPQASIGGPMDKSLQRQLSIKDPNDDPADIGDDPDAVTPFPLASRSDIEEECHLPSLRAAAMAADDAIEDTAGSLLNVLSTLDTTRRSARVAAETCLLSVANAEAKCIRSLIALERASIEDRLHHIEELERIADNIDVRADLDAYITADKKEFGGSTLLGEDDDGGVASALAVLSSHVEGSMGYTPSSKLMTDGWDQNDDDEEFGAEDMEDAVELLFDPKALDGEDEEKTEIAKDEFEKSVQLLCTVASDAESIQSRSLRSAICYAINQKRSSNAELKGQVQFDAICRVFDAILTGCDREASGVANAKMCMMLSQTFYVVEDKDDGESSERHERIFVKSRLMDHALWADEEYWDQALYQCVTESLTNSGVMANFERSARDANKSEWTERKKLKWHDLTQKERSEAAAQVHAVVFAQLGALAHSMIEFGCGIERSCAFVRRMAIRNQLPISQRAMLLQHLMNNGEEPGGDNNNNYKEGGDSTS